MLSKSRRINGIRKRVYECAVSSFGFSADSSRVTIWYADETDDLHCVVLFKEETQIRRFRDDIREQCRVRLITEYDLKPMKEVVVPIERVLLPLESTSYNPQDTSSNEVYAAPSEVSSSWETAVSLTSNPLVELQMLDAKEFEFVTSVALIRCHLISKAECENNLDFKRPG